jgi:DNA-binding response OmpR family regulator
MPGKTVLVIDDDDITRMLCRKVLEGAGFSVEEAPTLKASLEVAARHAPHLIILDLILPDGSGFDFLEKLNSLPDLRTVPVIVLSGSTDKAMIFHASALGAKDYLHKPMDARILLQKVKKTLREGGFAEYSFPEGDLPLVEVKIPGRILSANEVGFMLELAVKIAPDAQIDVQSPLLVELSCQDCVFQKTTKVAKSASIGQYINEVAAIGIGKEAVKKIREITRKWK